MSRQHGYVATYQHGCRCEQCREASAEYRGVARRRDSATGVEWPEAWWTAEAACTGQTDLFFAPYGERPEARRAREAEAFALCASCPVAVDCREYAFRIREEHGIWGGLTEGYRRQILRQRAKRTA